MQTGSTKYVDHPAPSIPTVMFFLAGIVLLVAFFPTVLKTSGEQLGSFYIAMLLLTLAILSFYLWPIYSTYYTLSPEGIHVRYGPWKRLYPWSDFKIALWQQGMFATRIGWPSVTPCVRFTNCVQLKRKKGWFPLYLTPNDPRAFLARISEFAPELTKETIL
jgi:uncharacterized protein with PQ loop repeat